MPMKRTHLSIVLACLATASPAYAHFHLTAPANWTTQTPAGNPQKVPPCGNDSSPEDNGPITEYKAGATIDVTITETTFHPGHYRVSLADDQSKLPPDPDGDVVADRQSPCGSLAINPNPTLPLLADGLLVHTARFAAPQTMKVTLPAGKTCDSCVLQIVEFMANHDASCFYHHCAKIKITTDGPVGGGGGAAGVGTEGGVGGGGADAGVGGGDAGAGGGGGDGGGGCSIGGAGITGGTLLLLGVGLLLARRRRR